MTPHKQLIIITPHMKIKKKTTTYDDALRVVYNEIRTQRRDMPKFTTEGMRLIAQGFYNGLLHAHEALKTAKKG
jgi:hypothetical protein